MDFNFSFKCACGHASHPCHRAHEKSREQKTRKPENISEYVPRFTSEKWSDRLGQNLTFKYQWLHHIAGDRGKVWYKNTIFTIRHNGSS